METQLSEIKLRSLSGWLEELGVTSITGWRWRKRGWIKTTNIAGRQYVSQQAIMDFMKRAEAGEFSRLKQSAISS